MRGFQGESEMRNSYIEDTIMGPAVYSDGDDFIDKATEAKTAAAQVKWARKAVFADLDCIDGYIFLAHHAESIGEKIALLREAVMIGDRLWASRLKMKDMHWWGFIGTRPYLRGKRYEEVEKLCAKYPDDIMIGMDLALLACCLAKDNISAAKKIAERMEEANPHTLPALASALRAQRCPPRGVGQYVSYGSKEGASGCINFAWPIWIAQDMRRAFLTTFERQVLGPAASGPVKTKLKKR
jgi:hypothetical protein